MQMGDRETQRNAIFQSCFMRYVHHDNLTRGKKGNGMANSRNYIWFFFGLQKFEFGQGIKFGRFGHERRQPCYEIEK